MFGYFYFPPTFPQASFISKALSATMISPTLDGGDKSQQDCANGCSGFFFSLTTQCFPFVSQGLKMFFCKRMRARQVHLQQLLLEETYTSHCLEILNNVRLFQAKSIFEKSKASTRSPSLSVKPLEPTSEPTSVDPTAEWWVDQGQWDQSCWDAWVWWSDAWASEGAWPTQHADDVKGIQPVEAGNHVDEAGIGESCKEDTELPDQMDLWSEDAWWAWAAEHPDWESLIAEHATESHGQGLAEPEEPLRTSQNVQSRGRKPKSNPKGNDQIVFTHVTKQGKEAFTLKAWPDPERPLTSGDGKPVDQAPVEILTNACGQKPKELDSIIFGHVTKEGAENFARHAWPTKAQCLGSIGEDFVESWRPARVVGEQLMNELGDKPTSSHEECLALEIFENMTVGEHLQLVSWYTSAAKFKEHVPAGLSDELWWEMKQIFIFFHAFGGTSADGALSFLQESYTTRLGDVVSV